MKKTTSSTATATSVTPSQSRKQQRGFSLMELIVVILIGSVLGLLAMPRINAFIISGKVEPSGKDVAQAVLRIRANAEGSGITPYTSVATATLANTLRDRSTALTVSAAVGATATATHGLGESGATLTAAPGTLSTLGDSFVVTFNQVNKGACPDLSTQLQNISEVITINGTTVKSIPAATAYNGQTAENACTAGNTNTFAFTFR